MGKGADRCEVYNPHVTSIGSSVFARAKTDEPIEMPFGLWTGVDRRMHKFNRILHVAPMCSYGTTRCRYLANTIEPSVCCGDAPYVKLL